MVSWPTARDPKSNLTSAPGDQSAAVLQKEKRRHQNLRYRGSLWIKAVLKAASASQTFGRTVEEPSTGYDSADYFMNWPPIRPDMCGCSPWCKDFFNLQGV